MVVWATVIDKDSNKEIEMSSIANAIHITLARILAQIWVSVCAQVEPIKYHESEKPSSGYQASPLKVK